MLCRNVKYHFGKMVGMAVAGKNIKPFPFRKLWQPALKIVKQKACVLRFRQECAVMDIGDLHKTSIQGRAGYKSSHNIPSETEVPGFQYPSGRIKHPGLRRKWENQMLDDILSRLQQPFSHVSYCTMTSALLAIPGELFYNWKDRRPMLLVRCRQAGRYMSAAFGNKNTDGGRKLC